MSDEFPILDGAVLLGFIRESETPGDLPYLIGPG